MKLRQVLGCLFALFIVGALLSYPSLALASNTQINIVNTGNGVNHVSTISNTGNNYVGDKVTICHKGNTISISVSALGAHLAHGDFIGSCPVSVPEFGLIPGAFAVLASAGSFYILKKRTK